MSKPISFGINGGITEKIVNATDPQRKIMRRPYTSASRPQSNYYCIKRKKNRRTSRRVNVIRTRKHPKERLYADTIHCCRLVGIFNSLPMVGRMITEDWTAMV